MKKFRCIKDYFFVDDFRAPTKCFTKDKIYTSIDEDYPEGEVLLIDDEGDMHFMTSLIRLEHFTAENDFKYGK
jgi:hypothetical protein